MKVNQALAGLKSTKEVSEITGLTRGYIAELCAAGKVPGAQKIGKTWVIPEEAIDIIVIITRGGGKRERGHIRKARDADLIQLAIAETAKAVSQAGEDV